MSALKGRYVKGVDVGFKSATIIASEQVTLASKFLNKFNSFLQFFLHKTNIKLSRLATISLLEAQAGICAEAGFIRRS